MWFEAQHSGALQRTSASNGLAPLQPYWTLSIKPVSRKSRTIGLTIQRNQTHFLTGDPISATERSSPSSPPACVPLCCARHLWGRAPCWYSTGHNAEFSSWGGYKKEPELESLFQLIETRQEKREGTEWCAAVVSTCCLTSLRRSHSSRRERSVPSRYGNLGLCCFCGWFMCVLVNKWSFLLKKNDFFTADTAL